MGDPEFDGIFVIKGYDPFKVRAKLTPELRACLLDIQAEHDLQIDDRCLHIRRVKTDMEVLQATAAKASLAAAALNPHPPKP